MPDKRSLLYRRAVCMSVCLSALSFWQDVNANSSEMMHKAVAVAAKGKMDEAQEKDCYQMNALHLK